MLPFFIVADRGIVPVGQQMEPKPAGVFDAAALFPKGRGGIFKGFIRFAALLFREASVRLVPKELTDLSPFHGSIFITSMGSLGIPPIYHHLYDFGNIPVFVAFPSTNGSSGSVVI